MDRAFKDKLHLTKQLHTRFRTGCDQLTEELWQLVPAEDKEENTLNTRIPVSTLVQVRTEYHILESLQKELEDHVMNLRKEVIIPNGSDKFGKPKTIKCQERHAWINQIEFNTRSTMMGLQGVYNRFLFLHQVPLLSAEQIVTTMIPPCPVPQPQTAAHSAAGD